MRKHTLLTLLTSLVCLLIFSVPCIIAQDFCKGDFDYDADVDSVDVTTFLEHFGRDEYYSPCPSDGPAPVPKTGQTKCYEYDLETWVEVDCVGTGHDAEYKKGVALPNPRFTDNGNGTVTDNLTGLMWLKDASCFGRRTWEDALSECNGLSAGQCGLTDGSNAGDWRLPNRFELESLLNLQYRAPILSNTVGTDKWSEGDPFTNVQSYYNWGFDVIPWYWSSTSIPYTDVYSHSWHAWYVDMETGDVNRSVTTSEFHVWPVRGGH